MAKISKKNDPKLWEKVKEDVTAGERGGRPGQWSARKAQMAVQGARATSSNIRAGAACS